jgi:predicted Rossmann fold flavoprotein
LGAGASGMMCAISAGKRGRKVLVIDHNEKPGKKVLISGGGKCNFTNYFVEPENYISQNPHFVKSALSRFNQWHFLELMTHIPYEERQQGQLFCQQSSKDIINMLLSECHKNEVTLLMQHSVQSVEKKEKFTVMTDQGNFLSDSLVVATGGLSWKSAGASNIGYEIARQFGLQVNATSPGLTPLKFSTRHQQKWRDLSGISVNVCINYQNLSFRDNLLFTHSGISGPAVLQVSNYWQKGDRIFVDFLPGLSLFPKLYQSDSQQTLKNVMKELLPERLVKILLEKAVENKPLNQYQEKELEAIAELFHNYPLKPQAKERYDKAEVTLGGVDTNELSSKRFEANKVNGLYFIGEVLDVTGWLGGYNLQWAWSSGYCAGLFV